MSIPTLFTDDPFDSALSVKAEIAGYEYLWLSDRKISFKKIANIFKENELATFEMLSKGDKSPEIYSELEKILLRAEIENDGYGVKLARSYDFPEKLCDAESPVEVLYYQGDWTLVDSKCMAIVGTRKPSSDSILRIKKLVKLLVNEGYTIVSGLAAGVDTVAHQTALECGGRTIAVLGTPITRFYPKQNKNLQQEIAKNHLLISQIPVLRYEKQPPQYNKFFFPERNATMSALSLGTIIVEASETSGTLVQARHAIKQDRKLFILNSCFENKELKWPQKYLKKGAIRVREFSDILGALEKKCQS